MTQYEQLVIIHIGLLQHLAFNDNFQKNIRMVLFSERLTGHIGDIPIAYCVLEPCLGVLMCSFNVPALAYTVVL